jgi:hypothetical protein
VLAAHLESFGQMKTAFALALVSVLAVGCVSNTLSLDETKVEVEAVVRSYSPDTMTMLFSDGQCMETHLFGAHLEIVSPKPRYSKELSVWSLREFGVGSPLTHVGERVRFTIPKKYLVEVLSDPTKKHDMSFLYADSIENLRAVPKSPNQAAEPSRATVTPPAGAGDRASGAPGSP